MEKTNEEHGAGFEGTDGLLSTYLQDTPKARITKWPDVLMSFEDWVNSSSSLLDEGVRMGKSDVSKIKGNYTIGFEFEVAVDEDYEDVNLDGFETEDQDELFKLWYNNEEEIAGFTWESYKESYYLPSIDDYFSDRNENEQTRFIVDMLLNVDPLKGWADEENRDILNTYTQFDTTQELIDYWRDNINDLPRSFYELRESPQIILSLKVSPNKPVPLRVMDSLMSLTTYFGYFREDEWFFETSFYEDYFEQDRRNAEIYFNSLLDSIDDDDIPDPIDYVEYFVNENFPNERLEVVPEQTQRVDGEIVTPPYPLESGLTMLKKILDAIDNDRYLFTNEKTGLHATMGDWSSNEARKIDWLKFLVIYGTESALKKFGRETNYFTPSKINDIIRSLQFEDFYDDRVSTWSRDPEAFKEVNNAVFKQSDKFSAFNFSKLLDKGILEFRGFGNVNYEKEADDIIFEIRKMIYAIEIASTPSLFRQEYLKGLYKLRKTAIPHSKFLLQEYYEEYVKLPFYIKKLDAVTTFLTVMRKISTTMPRLVVKFFDSLPIKPLREEIRKDVDRKKITRPNRMNPPFGEEIITELFELRRIQKPETVDEFADALLDSKGFRKLMKLYPPSGKLEDRINRIREMARRDIGRN